MARWWRSFTTALTAGGASARSMIESLLNKATALTLNPYLAPMLGAAECLSLRSIMDAGKILLVNLRTPDEESRQPAGQPAHDLL